MSGVDVWQRVLRSLEHPARRRLLVAILEHNPQSDVVVIPEDVHEGRVDPDTLQVEFEHVHLPLLRSHGYIAWDQGRGQVTKGPSFEEIRPVLELFEDHRDEIPDGWR
jgi:hypothetical protein